MIKQIGRYQVREEINRGGMGAVFRAYDPRFEREVAIKILPPTLLNEATIRKRFEREAKIVAALQHPCILPVHDFGEEQGVPYIVMRFMNGGSLQDRLEKGALPLDDIIHLLQRICPALDSAHAQGIVHRDLKPANILYDQYGYAFLADFGIARLTDTSLALTAQNAAMGTPPYMSPEQVKADLNVDHRSDIYALGIMLYEMLIGEVPYRAETPTKTMLMHVLQPVPSVLDVKPDLPFELELIIQRALAKEPGERYSSAGDMLAELLKLQDQLRLEAGRDDPTPVSPDLQSETQEEIEALHESIEAMIEKAEKESQTKRRDPNTLMRYERSRPITPPHRQRSQTPGETHIRREASELAQEGSPDSQVENTPKIQSDLIDRILMHYKSREERVAERQRAVRELMHKSQEKEEEKRLERHTQAQRERRVARIRSFLVTLFVILAALGFALYYIYNFL